MSILENLEATDRTGVACQRVLGTLPLLASCPTLLWPMAQWHTSLELVPRCRVSIGRVDVARHSDPGPDAHYSRFFSLLM